MRKSPTRFIRRVNNKFTSASLDLNFQNMTTSGFDSRITFTRASSGTFFNGSGILQTASTNVPRLDHNPTTLQSLGLLIEEQRTNSIRNNTMQGAVAGTPGTLPTNWINTTPFDGIDREVVGTGTTNGITWIDLKFSGTSSTGGSQILVQFEGAQVVAALQNQTWTPSLWVAVVGGSTANFSSLTIRHRYYNSSGSAITALDTSILSSVSATLTRFAGTAFAASNATTAFTSFLLNADFVNSSAIDITLRIGLPQLELGAFATSVIPTTVAAATRNADVASMTGTNFSSWYNATEGTLYAEFQALNAPNNASAVVAITDGTTNNYIYIGTRAGSAVFGSNSRDSGGSVVSIGSFGASNTNLQKSILAYKINDYASTFNAAAVATGTNTVPTVDRLNVAALTSGNRILGHIRRIAYYPVRLSNDQLQALTR